MNGQEGKQFDDYRTDSEYEINYTREINPEHIRLTLALQGLALPELNGEPFRYLELGCGFGLSLAIHAAANDGEYWSVDFMEKHIEYANGLAAASGSNNTRLFCKSFADTDAMSAAGELPMFDMIVFHGIYTWVNLENRQHILNIVKRNLKPGGVVYNSYNSLPGWSHFLPVQEVMRLNVERLGEARPVEERIRETLEFMKRLGDAGAGYLKTTPAARENLKKLEKYPVKYLAQEYFNTTWKPFFFKEVADDMRSVDCSFAGLAHLLSQTGALLPPETRTILAEVHNKEFRETLRDFCSMNQFRADLYVRNPKYLNTRDHEALVNDLSIVLLKPLKVEELRISAVYGVIQLDKELYSALIAALSDGGMTPKRIGDIFSRPGLDNIDPRLQRECISVLVGTGWASVAKGEVLPQQAAACRGINRELCTQMAEGQKMMSNVLASPVLGGALRVTPDIARALLYKPVGEGEVDRDEWAKNIADSFLRVGKSIDYVKALAEIHKLLDSLYPKDGVSLLDPLEVTI